MVGILMFVDPEELKSFEDKSRTYANGTMDVILPHFMSLQDMEKSQKNLNHAIEISQTMRKLKELLIREEKIEAMP